MIIPGLFELLEKVVGPLFTSGAKTSIVSGLVGSAVKDSGGLMGIITGALGKLEDAKVAEIKAGVEILLAQTQVIQSDTNSKSIFSSWHAIFCFGMTFITLTHFAVAEAFNILVALHFDNVGIIAPMDTATLFFIGSVLGITMAGKTVERVNSNNQDDN